MINGPSEPGMDWIPTGFQFAGLLKSRREIKSVCSRLQDDGIVCDSPRFAVAISTNGVIICSWGGSTGVSSRWGGFESSVVAFGAFIVKVRLFESLLLTH